MVALFPFCTCTAIVANKGRLNGPKSQATLSPTFKEEAVCSKMGVVVA